jgi:GNAT superfamily N-acetyltransferase
VIEADRQLELQRACLRVWLADIGRRSEGARLFERHGVTGAIVPATPDRSIPNSVTYEDAAGLADALDELAAIHDAAGVRAWTVWVPEHDAEAVAVLERAGHTFDGKPAAMTLRLAELEPAEVGDLDWDRDASAPEAGRINDLAYGFEGSGFGVAIGTEPAEPPVRLYRARVDDEVACVLQTIDAAQDCGVYYVATHPRHRGRGLATRLMTAALLEARERGCGTSTLQSSPMGYPVYERLGYRSAFRLHLYERRK